MTLYKAVRNIPDGPNNPSVDQPKMKLNNNSFIDLIDVDHYGYNQANGGYHEIIHQPPEVSDPIAIPGIGQTYTKTLNGDEQLFYESGLGVVNQLSGIYKSGTGSLPGGVSNTFVTILSSLPLNCSGILNIDLESVSSVHTYWVVHFAGLNGVLYAFTNAGTTSSFNAAGAAIYAQINTPDLEIKSSTGYNSINFSYVYWLV